MKKLVYSLLTLIIAMVSFCTGVNIICKRIIPAYEKLQKREKRLNGYYELLIRWMDLVHNNKSLEQYFLQENIRTIAVYGMGEIGTQLLLELKKSNIDILYAIDQNVEEIEGIPVYKPESNLMEVDAIVVTPFFAFDEIKELIQPKVACRILSLEDIVYGIY